MSNKNIPITRTRQEVKNIDSGGGGGDYVTKEDQYAYGINTFTTENGYLKDVEIVSKDKTTTEKANIPSALWTTDYEINSVPSNNLYHKMYDNIYIKFTNTWGDIDLFCYNRYTNSHFSGISLTRFINRQSYISSQYDVKIYFPKNMNNSQQLLSDYNYNEYINSYSHTLTISKGNEFEGLVIKYVEKPTKLTSTAITTPDLFITNINYIKDVVGFILKDGVVTPYVFTYKDSVLYLNGTEIDVNSLTITDEVVKL